MVPTLTEHFRQMNYFAHAYLFLDNPYLAAGTGVPDWLSVVDRRCRVRRKFLEARPADPDPARAAVLRGALQHLADDSRFHQTRAFAELTLQFSQTLRGLLADDEGFRPSFLGHLLVELLLDATLIARHPDSLERYYRVLDGVDADLVERAINLVTPRPTARLAWMISRFRQARILWDYLEDGKLLGRLNQVMRRVGFAALPDSLVGLLPELRTAVAGRADELLAGIPVPLPPADRGSAVICPE